MKAAYSLRRADDGDNVQLSGIEKGVKNRYKDILPFEHARVRLGGRVEESATMSTPATSRLAGATSGTSPARARCRPRSR